MIRVAEASADPLRVQQNVNAGGLFTMKGGHFGCSGKLTFRAGSTDIWTEILYGTLDDAIGGAPDTSAPEITVLSPVAASTIDGTVELQVRVTDPAPSMGLKSLQVGNLVTDTTRKVLDCGPTSAVCSWSQGDSTFRATMPAINPATPGTLEVTVVDNKGRMATAAVANLAVQSISEVEPNAEYCSGCCTIGHGSLKNHPCQEMAHVKRFVLRGTVNQSDDESTRQQTAPLDLREVLWVRTGQTDPSGIWIREFCEDLVLLDDYFEEIYEVNGKTAISATLSWFGPSLNLNLYKVHWELSPNPFYWTNVVAGERPNPRLEQKTLHAILSGPPYGSWPPSQLLCVSWADGSATTDAPIPYSLSVKIVRAVTFSVKIPDNTASAASPVHVVGNTDAGASWDVPLQPMGGLMWWWWGTWHYEEGTRLDYKYVLGDATHAELSTSCGEAPSRTLVLGSGVQDVEDTVANWKGVAPCPP